MDVPTPVRLLRGTEEHHGTYEPTALPHHSSDRCAAHSVARDRGRTRDEAAAEAGRHVEAVLR